MPTYEYKCSNCGEIFEYFQKMSDDPIRECPVCGGNLKRVISGGIGVIFKGSGFYTTDYKNSSGNISSKKKEKKSDAAMKESDSKKPKTSDKKMETKT